MNFKDLQINIVKHDTGSAEGCLPAYIEVQLGHNPKDKGSLVLDLGNYIYNTFHIPYQMCPEYRGKGKKTTVRWFMSKKDFETVRLSVLTHYGKESMIKIEGYIPFEFNSLSLQKGV